MIGASKTRLRKTFSKSELCDVTRDPEDCTIDIELLRGKFLKLVVIMYDVKIMTHIMHNLPEGYKSIAGTLEEKLDGNIYPLTIEIIQKQILKIMIDLISNTIKTSKSSHRSCCTCVNSKENATNVARAVTGLENVKRHLKKSNVHTARKRDTLYKNISTRIRMINNAHHVKHQFMAHIEDCGTRII